MITTHKRKDLEKLAKGDHDLHNELTLVGDKLRVIYTALGWTHMTREFGEADRIVESLTLDVLKVLNDDPESDPQHGSAGLIVSGYIDAEDYLNLDYSFLLI